MVYFFKINELIGINNNNNQILVKKDTIIDININDTAKVQLFFISNQLLQDTIIQNLSYSK